MSILDQEKTNTTPDEIKSEVNLKIVSKITLQDIKTELLNEAKKTLDEI